MTSRPKTAPDPIPEGDLVDEAVVTEVTRHGPSSGAEVLAAVGHPPAAVIDRAIRLVETGVLRVVQVEGEARFTTRRRDR